jgi:hypothetical protein
MLRDPDGSRAAIDQLLATRPWYFDSKIQLPRMNRRRHFSGLRDSQSNSFLTVADYDKHLPGSSP